MAVEALRNGKKAAVLEALRQGNNRRAACEAVGIGHTTFYRWLEEDGTLRDAVEKAEAEAEQYFVGRVKAATAEQWTAAAWWLERKRPDDWGKRERLEHTGPNGSQIKIVVEYADAPIAAPSSGPGPGSEGSEAV